jgi:peptide/nickel transport system ATP-binding protein
MPNYCYFKDRCELCIGQCDGVYPPEIKISDTHTVSCYRYLEEGKVLEYPVTVNLEELYHGK